MIDGVNDGKRSCRVINPHGRVALSVNLIPYNPVPGVGYQPRRRRRSDFTGLCNGIMSQVSGGKRADRCGLWSIKQRLKQAEKDELS